MSKESVMTDDKNVIGVVEPTESAAVEEEIVNPANGTTMNVYTALSKRKILQKQLESALSKIDKVCAAAFAGTAQINGKPREDAIRDMKAAYDRPRAIIRNLQKINSAIAISNATTKVTVAGKEYTVEEMIFRSIHINDEINFYNAIVKQLNEAKIAVEQNRIKNLTEEVIAAHVDKLLPTMVPVDAPTEIREKTAESIRSTYITNMTMEIVDPYNLLTKMEDTLRELQEFKEDINNALNICNIQTIITVDLED